MRGRAFVFGDDVNTGYITPSEYVGEPMAEIVKHLFEPIRPDVASELESGEFVVAGTNFGAGSSRETAPAALKHAEVGAVIAESFARIFYRNCIAVGLLPITAPGITDAIEDGDDLELRFDRGVIVNRTRDRTVDHLPLPPTMREICEAGGLLAYHDEHSEGIEFDS
jgi:3-isopropylmalate/(R)-2-methylmalate dehydratase small subunit